MHLSIFEQALNSLQIDLNSINYTQLNSSNYLKPIPKSGLKSVNFVSGEVNFDDFQNILSTATVNDQDIFVDLGSGYGHCIASAALFCDKNLIPQFRLL